jgi:maltokinase
VRPITAEQSNSSLVYDDRLILKVFRRIGAATNPDVEVTEALAAEGFDNVAAPVGVWRLGDVDLAFLQEYLVDGLEGWALALTSLRDMYATGSPPDECGGDFASEAARLGTVTAAMHLAMATAFGSEPGDVRAWSAAIGPRPSPGLDAVVERLAAVADGGRAIRPHGDYHLGQTMRTERGWFVLDFEGEPARSFEERRRFTSPLKDVTGMLRSFHYAAAVALRERDASEHDDLRPLGSMWEARNRQAFLEGYLGTDGIDSLLPADQASFAAVRDAFELDKAIYELHYERSHRPDWVDIPMAALRRLAHD